MKAKHNWFAIGAGKSSINRARVNKVQTAADSGEHALMGGSVSIWFEVIDVVGVST